MGHHSLAALSSLLALQTLEITDTELGSAEAPAFAIRLARLQGLTRLNLTRCHMCRREHDDPALSAASLAQALAQLTALQELDLTDTSLSAAGAAVVSPVISSMPSLTSLTVTQYLDMTKHDSMQRRTSG